MKNIDTFIFDLDHTLYDASTGVFSEMHDRMTAYVSGLLDVSAEEADEIRNQLYVNYGTTLSGLVGEHNVNAHEFLDYVHGPLDMKVIQKCAETVDMIRNLPGRKLIYTNAPIEHANNVLEHLEMDNLFEGVFDLKAADFVSKPNRGPFDTFVKKYDVTPETCVMLEDTAKNLKTAQEVGFKTIWLSHGRDVDPEFVPYIDAEYINVKHWLDEFYKDMH